MKLNSFCRVFLMTNPHNFPIFRFRTYFQTFRKIFSRHGQGVIPHGFKRVPYSLIDHLAVGMDHGSLSMHESFGRNHVSTKCSGNSLMAEADPKDRDLTRKVLDNRYRKTGGFRSSGAG